MMEGLAYLREMNVASVLLRLTLAMLFGGFIGLERERKRRPAGFRTYMMVCLGAALTMLLSQYESYMVTHAWHETAMEIGLRTDVSRFGAQVINGIGFLGAGTIIVTGKQEVKGLTTAAGLWASSCMGHSRKGCTSSAASLSSMCTKFLVKNTGSCLHRATVFSRSSCGVMPMPPFRVVCRAVGRAPGAKRQRRLGLLQRKTGLFQTARIRRVVKNRRSAPAKRSPIRGLCPFFSSKGRAPFPQKEPRKRRVDARKHCL